MEESTKAFIKKIKINTYIYTFIFMAVGVMYTAEQEISLEPFMLLLAAFAFYTLGRQVNLLSDIEAGTKLDTQPRAPIWVRGVVYLVVLLMIFSVMFSLNQ